MVGSISTSRGVHAFDLQEVLEVELSRPDKRNADRDRKRHKGRCQATEHAGQRFASRGNSEFTVVGVSHPEPDGKAAQHAEDGRNDCGALGLTGPEEREARGEGTRATTY